MTAIAFYNPVGQQNYAEEVRPVRNKPRLAEKSAPDIDVYDEMERKDFERRLRVSIESLLELGSLGEDWDGDGARAPIPELIESAIQLIRSRGFIPARSVPINDGRIALDFYEGKTYLSARIDAPGLARVMIVEPGSATKFGTWKWSTPMPKLAWVR